MRLTASAASELASSGADDDSKLNPADMLSQYKNSSLEFGSGGTNASTSATTEGQTTIHNSIGTPGTTFGEASQIDISQGAQRLAKELDEFVAKGLETNGNFNAQTDSKKPSDDAIAELQLQTARKLRQVSQLFLISELFSQM